jgi:hypothetical protein
MSQFPPPRPVIITKTKSIAVSLLLTFFFGPFGMLYSTIPGALIMLVVSAVVAVLTLGHGLFITHPICMLWGALAAHRYNQRLLRMAGL